MSARTLLTGFGPFSRWARNSSEAAVGALGGEGRATRVLPVDHLAAADALARALAEEAPTLVLLMGLAPAPAPRLELVARRPAHLAEGAPSLSGLWPWEASLAAMRAAGCAGGLSRDAGRYVCETSYWTALALRLSGTAGPRFVAFLHLPPISQSWPEPRLAAAARACLEPAERALRS